LALDNQLEPVDRIMDHPTEVIRIEARFSEIVLGTPFYGERSYMIISYVDQHDNRDGRCGGSGMSCSKTASPSISGSRVPRRVQAGFMIPRGALMISRRPSSCNMSCLRAFFVALDANLDV
jgi:hypothetical protein